jgi:hypothetical protein
MIYCNKEKSTEGAGLENGRESDKERDSEIKGNDPREGT